MPSLFTLFLFKLCSIQIDKTTVAPVIIPTTKPTTQATCCINFDEEAVDETLLGVLLSSLLANKIETDTYTGYASADYYALAHTCHK